MSSAASIVGLVCCLLICAGCSPGAGEDSPSRGSPMTAQAGTMSPAGGSAASSGGQGGAGGVAGSMAGVSGSSGSPSAGSSGMTAASAGRSGAPAGRGAAAAGGSSGKPADSAGSAGAPAMKGELFGETFEDGDLTKPSWIDAEPELGGMWTVASAEGGKVLAQTASVDDWVIAAAGDYRWTDQVVEAKVKITSEPGKAGVFARVRDLENYYFLYLDGGSNIVLRKRVDNSSNDVQKVKVETMQGVWYTLKLSVIGDKLEGSLDGKLLVSGTDSAVKTGGVGVGTAECTAQFDDVTVRN